MDELVKSGFLNDYLAEPERIRGMKCPLMGRSTPSRWVSQVEGALHLSASGMHDQ